MNVSGERYTLSFDALDQQVNFEGMIRTTEKADLDGIRQYLIEVHDRVDGSMRLNFRKMRYLNSAALMVIADFLKYARSGTSSR